jgi:glutamine amidotransferase
MCRHLAYLGPPVSLATLLIAPPHGLFRQAWAPRRQAHGAVNADGFGVGWYAPGDPAPARYRRAVPIWTDPSFADVARVTTSGAVLAAVRSATVGTNLDESAAAPFTEGRWLFSHNGVVDGWPDSLAALARALPPERLLRLESRVDSAVLWALAIERLSAGQPMGEALAAIVADVTAVTSGRLNLLVTDGERIAATVVGETLCWSHREGGLVVASEPSDDLPGWHEVPNLSLLSASVDGVAVTALSEVSTCDPAPIERRHLS